MQYDSQEQKQAVITAIKQYRGMSIEEVLKFTNAHLSAIVNGAVVPPIKEGNEDSPSNTGSGAPESKPGKKKST